MGEITPCTYCGLPATCRDHLLPTTWTRLPQGRASRYRRHIPWVWACHECNSLLSDLFVPTPFERRDYVREQLRKRHRRLLALPDWTEDEIEEMEGTLQSYIRGRQVQREILRERLDWETIPEIHGVRVPPSTTRGRNPGLVDL